MSTFVPVPSKETDTLPFRIRNKFKFYNISWCVENFYLQTCEENWEICSPEIDGPRGSRLKLILRCSRGQDMTNSTVSFVVRRLNSDSGPEALRVNSRVHVFDPNIATKHLGIDKSCSLRRGSESETDFTGMSGIFDDTKIMLIKADLFLVDCKIIIYSEKEDLGLEECSDAGLRSLSDDMLLLLESSREVDVELRIGSSILLAHKSILCARCKWFDHLIGSEMRQRNPVEGIHTLDLSNSISDSQYEGMRKILTFIYTGNLIHILEEPSLSIHDLAVLFDMAEIKNFYIPEILHFVSTTDAQEFAFNCCIPGFNSACESEIRLLSPVFTEVRSGRTWQLHFYPRVHEATGFVAVYVETDVEIKSTNVCLEISVVNRCDHLGMRKMQRKRVDGSTMFGFAEFEYKNWIKYYAIGDILNFEIKIRLSTGEQKSCCPKHVIPVISCDRRVTPYDTLAADLKVMFETGLFYDGQFETPEGCLHVHKCILALRCSALYDMLNGRGEDDPIFLQDMCQDSLMVLLTYIYSGTVWDIGRYETDYVLKAAEDFNLPHLRDFCLALPGESGFQFPLEYESGYWM